MASVVVYVYGAFAAFWGVGLGSVGGVNVTDGRTAARAECTCEAYAADAGNGPAEIEFGASNIEPCEYAVGPGTRHVLDFVSKDPRLTGGNANINVGGPRRAKHGAIWDVASGSEAASVDGWAI